MSGSGRGKVQECGVRLRGNVLYGSVRILCFCVVSVRCVSVWRKTIEKY